MLATRPKPQNAELCQAIADEGGRPIALPAIQIVWLNKDVEMYKSLISAEILIFISVNAVEGYSRWKGQGDDLKANVQIAAIGNQTKSALRQHSLAVGISPENGYNSEALLRSPRLSAEKISGKSIAIIRGEGGRDYLRDELRARGAIVKYVEAYRRACPVAAAVHFTINDIDIISVTSNAGLSNLLTIVGQKRHQNLFQRPLLVLSQRMAVYAKKLGFKRDILIANGPNNQAIINSIATWHSDISPTKFSGEIDEF